ncbi:MAG: zinc ribbon domain-containing protein [Lentimicrobiaceae bacterium]|nr:zinc ribbon domain-containing protein [Lentimicrobiaceae bacterium]MCO5266529.1 zinc ribbon domain-containing protein [Lentimicrobium sp.]
MKFCPQCGTPLEPGSRFCQECGFDITSLETVEQEVSFTDENRDEQPDIPPVVHNDVSEKAHETELASCPQCGVKLAAEDRFCQECGFDTSGIKPLTEKVSHLEETTSAPGDIITDETTKAPPVADTSANAFCSGCGAPMTPGDAFCQECGAGINTATTATAAPPPPAKPVPPVRPQPSPAEFQPVNPPPVTNQTSAAFNVSVNQAPASTSPKKKKGLLIVLLGLLALAVLGAGGWLAYDKYMKSPAVPVVDSTLAAVQQETSVVETQMPDTSEMAINQAPETQITTQQQTTSAKQTTPKKPAPKKQSTVPQKTEPQQEPPVQNNEPLKVKIKPTGAKTGRIILSIHNNNDVKSGPLFASKLKLDKAFIITKITTYHHNWGKGAQPGTISLQRKKETFGPWQARGAAGDDGTPNGKWICEPNIRLDDGNYKVSVSDDKSWSYNSQSGQKGFVVIEGYEAE